MNYDLVLHIDLDDEKVFKILISNVTNYLNGLEKETFNLQVVANGPAVTLFVKTREDLRTQVAPLAARGAVFKLCANALGSHGIGRNEVWPECEIVPAGLIELVRLQNAGYAYVKP